MSELQDSADHLVVVGRGKVIADTTVAELLAAVAGDRVTLRTASVEQAMNVLERAGASVEVTAADTLTISGLVAQSAVAALASAGVPFWEVTAHRVTLEHAYLELTKDAVEFRPAEASAAQEVAR
jgi:ABC-2 type transport system ATP-binding protein